MTAVHPLLIKDLPHSSRDVMRASIEGLQRFRMFCFDSGTAMHPFRFLMLSMHNTLAALGITDTEATAFMLGGS